MYLLDNAKDFMKEKLTISTPAKQEENAVEVAHDISGGGGDNHNSDIVPPVPAVNYGFSDFQHNGHGDELTTNDDDEADAIAALASRITNKKGGMNSVNAPPASNNNNNTNNSSNVVKNNNNNNTIVTPNPYEVGILVPQIKRRPIVVEEKPATEQKVDTADANCKCNIM